MGGSASGEVEDCVWNDAVGSGECCGKNHIAGVVDGRLAMGQSVSLWDAVLYVLWGIITIYGSALLHQVCWCCAARYYCLLL